MNPRHPPGRTTVYGYLAYALPNLLIPCQGSAIPSIAFWSPSSSLARLRPQRGCIEGSFCSAPPEERLATELSIKMSILRLFFPLGDESLRLRNIPASSLPKPVPKVVKRGQVPRLDKNHAVIRGAPDMRVLPHDSHVLPYALLETLPLSLRLLLVRLRQRPNTVEDQEREYQTVTPWPALGQA